MYKVLSKDLRFPPGKLWRLSLGKVSTEFCIVKAGMRGREMRSVYHSVLISSWWMCSSDCNYIYLTLYWDAGLSWNGHAPRWLFGADLKILNLCLKYLLHFFSEEGGKNWYKNLVVVLSLEHFKVSDLAVSQRLLLTNEVCLSSEWIESVKKY